MSDKDNDPEKDNNQESGDFYAVADRPSFEGQIDANSKEEEGDFRRL